MSVFDKQTNTLLQTIPLPTHPNRLALDASATCFTSPSRTTRKMRRTATRALRVFGSDADLAPSCNVAAVRLGLNICAVGRWTVACAVVGGVGFQPMALHGRCAAAVRREPSSAHGSMLEKFCRRPLNKRLQLSIRKRGQGPALLPTRAKTPRQQGQQMVQRVRQRLESKMIRIFVPLQALCVLCGV